MTIPRHAMTLTVRSKPEKIGRNYESGERQVIYGTIEGIFRSIISAGWGVKSCGSVQESGHYAVVEIPTHVGERAEMKDAVFSEDEVEAEAFDMAESGWYFVREDTSGNISWQPCFSQHDAFRIFAEVEQGLAFAEEGEE